MLRVAIFTTTVAVAFASLVYEFVLAQAMATTMGYSVLRYNLTIALFVAALGLGVLLYPRLRGQRIDLFIVIEVLLSLLGAGAGPLLLIFQGVSWSEPWLVELVGVLLVVAIGLLSGFELPLLMDLDEKVGRRGGGGVLVADYGGMLLGAIAFPLVILPHFHIFTAGYWLGALNLLIACLWLMAAQLPGVKDSSIMAARPRAFTWLALPAALILLALLGSADAANAWLVEVFFLGEL